MRLGPYAVAALCVAAIVTFVLVSLGVVGPSGASGASGLESARAAAAAAAALTPLGRLRYEPVAVAGILTVSECARLIEHAAPRLARSKTLGEVVSEVRTSEQAWLEASDAAVGDIVVKVRARAAQLTGVLRPELFEQMQVVRYTAGQEYRPHLDACVESCDRSSKPRINRRATLLVYLTDDFEAGGTLFGAIGVRVRPKRGDGVLFYNTDADTGAELADSLHAGEPVASGTKWVANCWVQFDPAPTRA